MACPQCGRNACDCRTEALSCAATSFSSSYSETTLVEPERWDDSEEQFESSLVSSAQPEHYKSFVPGPMNQNPQGEEKMPQQEQEDDVPVRHSAIAQRRAIDRELTAEANDWRNAISNKLDIYRNRRGRNRLSGEYTMHLDFERSSGRAVVATAAAPVLDSFFEPETAAVQEAAETEPVAANSAAPAWDMPLEQPAQVQPAHSEDFFGDAVQASPVPNTLEADRRVIQEQEPEPAPPKRRDRKVIQFPRLFSVEQASTANELAEPVLDRPRIIDVPEETEQIELPLGDIALEPTEMADVVREIETPIQVAPVSQRVVAAVMDAVLIVTATALFDAIVLTVTKGVVLNKLAIAAAAALPFVLASIYNYLFLVHAAATPGMAMAQLRVATFEGNATTKRSRRMRALAMLVSFASASLGFAWAAVDEDTLCWHDRISRTYLMKR